MKPRNLIRQIFSGSLLPALFLASILLIISFTGRGEEHLLKNPVLGKSIAITNGLSLFGGHGEKTTIRENEGIYPTLDYVRWKGDFHYRLDYDTTVYESSAEFMKMKGLKGETSERIKVDGHIVFTQAKKKSKDRIFTLPGYFAGEGSVSYTIARMSLSGLGDARVVHFTDGKGKDLIKRRQEDTYLKINRARNTYSIRITPGSYEADIDAFGVKVLSSSEMKVTRAFIEKMESEGTPVMYPEALKEMFPEYDWYPDRDNIVLEAFDVPLSGSRNILKGSCKDEKGGVLSWDFKAF